MVRERSRHGIRAFLTLLGTAIAAAGVGVFLSPHRHAHAQVLVDEAALLERAAASRAKGREDAPVLIYEISDFQCPYCRRFARDVFPLIDSTYVATGKVQWVFVNLPLPSHPRSWGAAKAALCAGAVADAFWSFRDRLFATQREWVDSSDALRTFVRLAREAGIPVAPFQDCLFMDRVAPLLLEDVLFAATADVTGTPTFIIHPNHNVVGLKSFEEWQMVIEAALERRAAEEGR